MNNSKYKFYFDLIAQLNNKTELIPTPKLYDYDPEKVYVDTLNNLAQPLADGGQSPFSSRNPFSAEGVLIAQIINMLYYSAWREANLIPEILMLSWFKTLGLAATSSEAPVIELEFIRTTEAVSSGIPSVIPLGLQLRSRYYSDRIATVQEEVEVAGERATVAAKINSLGKIVQPIVAGEFNLLPLGLKDFAAVNNIRLLSTGSNATTVAELVKRGISTLTKPGKRIITARDYVTSALEAGATKAILLPNLAIGADDTISFSDVANLVVYPESVADIVRNKLIPLVPAGTNFVTTAAKIIPLDGDITVRVDPSFTQGQSFDLIATRIQEKINPPNGIFGDRDFATSLAVALEEVRGIIAVPFLSLKHSQTNIALEDIEVLPHYLFEIQASLNIVYA